LGVFDFSLFRRELTSSVSLRSAKESEEDFYKPLRDTCSYADRHPIFAFKNKFDKLLVQGSNLWRGIILAKVPLDVENELSGSLLDKWKDLLKNYLYGLSCGWETLIFVINGSLNEIFKAKELLISMDWVERTETIITMDPYKLESPSHQAEDSGDSSNSSFAVHATVKLKDFGKLKSSLPSSWFLYPGRHDLLKWINEVSEREVPSVLIRLFSEIDTLVNGDSRIEDVRIDILKKA
jgi:hypothetical protein